VKNNVGLKIRQQLWRDCEIVSDFLRLAATMSRHYPGVKSFGDRSNLFPIWDLAHN
jgi:hypothetical protein